MAISITVGAVTVSINPAAATDPVVPHPLNAAATFAAFVESVAKNGLAETVFDAFPAVANINDISLAKVKWPTFYGTSTPPWGTVYDPVTGVREVLCIDDMPDVRRWTDAVLAMGLGRKSFLDQYAETAVAIATGIKQAIESTFRSGRVTLVAGAATVSGVTFTSDSEILVSRRTIGAAPGIVSLNIITPGSPGSFTLESSNPADDGVISWLVVG